MDAEARKKALEKAGLSYADFGRRFRPPVKKQMVGQAINGQRQSDRVCRGFARLVGKPVEKVFPEFYASR